MTNVASMARHKLRNSYVHVQEYSVDTLVMLSMILALVYIGMILGGRHPAATLVVAALSLNTTYRTEFKRIICHRRAFITKT